MYFFHSDLWESFSVGVLGIKRNQDCSLTMILMAINDGKVPTFDTASI